mmetsp:Transcript_25813/g.60519  ORF Transcript_25813/g.60519 Transcript_25813/m.60519 type:complete len:427 (-) Transcript_25813:169-1449(-)
MRHGRSKAARKTLRYFERTVNLKSKPYYSVLMDATFLVAMVRITSNNAISTGKNDEDDEGKGNGSIKSESTIVSRIERVLQVNGGGGSSFSGYAKDNRLSGVVDYQNYDNNSQSRIANSNNGSGNGHHFQRYNVRYFIPQEAVDEIETILNTFRERSERTKKQKKQRSYKEKSKVFEDALAWIKSNSNSHKKQSGRHRGIGRCEVLPRLEKLTEPSDKTRTQPKSNETEAENDGIPPQPTSAISASDAVRRHIARDDGREDPESNTKIDKKQQKQQQPNTITRTYIVASQEEELLDDLRMLGTVPILRCTNNASVLILEHPSKKGQRTDKGQEHTKWHGALPNEAERALVDAAWKAQKKERVRITGGDDPSKRGQATRAKAPNPLSCKRKRTGPDQQQPPGESKSKKRRARAQRKKAAAAASLATE